jgi:hypothetical protein
VCHFAVINAATVLAPSGTLDVAAAMTRVTSILDALAPCQRVALDRLANPVTAIIPVDPG